MSFSRLSLMRLLVVSSLYLFISNIGSEVFDFNEALPSPIRWTILGYLLYHLAASITRFERLPWVAILHLVFDIILVTVITQWTGKEQSLFTSLYFFPILIGATRFDLLGGISAAVTSSLAMVLMMSLTSFDMQWSKALMHFFAFAVTGLMSGVLSARLKSARDTISHLEEINHAVIENIPSGIILFDSSSSPILINPSGKKILGLETLQPNDPLLKRFEETLILESSSDDRHVAHYNHPQLGRRDLGYSIAKLPDPLVRGKKATLFSFQDLTRIHQIQQQLWNSKKLAAIGRLAASIAHEIRNPLASISGCVEMLQSFVPAEEEPKKLMRIALKETERLNKLINEFLDYVRQEKLETMREDLCRLVTEIAEEIRLRKDLPSNVSIDVRVPSHSVTVSLSINKFKQALLNLIINGVQSISGGGSVTLHLSEEKENVLLTISDTGSGIPNENLEKIFDPFFTTKEKGTGLGLSMTQKIIELHNGKISVESKVNQGTRFTIALPKA